MDDWRLGPNDDRALSEALEACRADGGDLSDPALESLALRLAADAELAERWTRIQAFDRKIAGAFMAIPVPEGVRQRVLARLVAAAETAEAIAGAPPADPPAASAPRPSQPPSESRPAPARRKPARPSPARRRLLVVAALSAAAAVAVAVWLGDLGTAPRDARQVLDETQQTFLADRAAPGALLTEASPPAGLPLSREVAAQSPAVRWRPVEQLLGTKAVAYDLPARRGVRATLYVARVRVAGLPDRPPLVPSRNTGGAIIGAWQEGPLLYVLAVEGNESDYRRLLRGPSGPVAWLALQPSKSA